MRSCIVCVYRVPGRPISGIVCCVFQLPTVRTRYSTFKKQASCCHVAVGSVVVVPRCSCGEGQ